MEYIMSSIYYVCIPFSTNSSAESMLRRVNSELGYDGSVYFSPSGSDVIERRCPQVGQHWLHRDSGEEYILAEAGRHDYVLICLDDGIRWDDPCGNIEDVFGTSAMEEWKLERDV